MKFATKISPLLKWLWNSKTNRINCYLGLHNEPQKSKNMCIEICFVSKYF
jgi:hypothetical protein